MGKLIKTLTKPAIAGRIRAVLSYILLDGAKNVRIMI
jgi:hypothetical protein